MMKLPIPTVIVVIALGVIGCATTKILTATGGSRADGVVELSYEYRIFQKPVIQWEQGAATASDRCGAWGYSGAERFGGSTPSCQAYQGQRCVRHLVTVLYQCIGSPESNN